MSDGKPAEYEALKSTEIEEFYRILDIWTEQKNKERESLKA